MELYTWEYEGRKYYGFMRHGRLWGKGEDDVIEAVLKSEVSNFHPAKVVDALVIDNLQLTILRLAVKEGIEGIDSWRTKTYPQPDESVKARGAFAVISQIVDGFSIPLTPPVTKTYLKTKQFIKVWKSLDDAKIKELSAARDAARDSAWDFAWDSAWAAAWDEVWFAPWSEAWEAAWDAARDAAWSAAWSADLAVLVKDKITTEQFEILTKPWTSCGLSLFAEDWDEVLNPRITEPTGFGAIVEAKCIIAYPFANWGEDSWAGKWLKLHGGKWQSTDGHQRNWSDLINPTILSEGQK